MRRAVMLLIMVLCLGLSAHSQTAEELINKNIEAKGGIEKIKAIKSMRMTGKLKGGGFTGATGQDNLRPNLVRETLSLQGMTSVQAYDGARAGRFNPLAGQRIPSSWEKTNCEICFSTLTSTVPWWTTKRKGNTVEYLGHDVVDGDDALRLKVTQKDGDIIYTISIPIPTWRFAKKFRSPSAVRFVRL
jgi:hypothetical protein